MIKFHPQKRQSKSKSMMILLVQVFLLACFPSVDASSQQQQQQQKQGDTIVFSDHADESSSSIFATAIATRMERMNELHDHFASTHQDSKQEEKDQIPVMPEPAAVTIANHNSPNSDDDSDDSDSEDQQPPFCSGMPMTMFMDGFHWSLFWRGSHNETNTTTTTTTTTKPPRCLVYFVSSWELSEEGKFKGAMVFSFLMGLLMEGLSAMRSAVSRQGEKSAGSSSSSHNILLSNRQRHLHHFLMTFIYAVQGLLGYLLMFLAMAYSMELVLSTVLGLVVGNVCLIRYEYPKASSRRVDYVPPTAASTTAATTTLAFNNNKQNNNNNCAEREPLLSASSSNPMWQKYKNMKEYQQNAKYHLFNTWFIHTAHIWWSVNPHMLRL